MMFPTGDPFAYPNQPMSTLEDDHFKHDHLRVGTSNSTQISTPVESSPSGQGFNNASMFPGGSSNSGTPLGFPNYQNMNKPSSGRSQHLRSPSSRNEAIHNPDLVSMPNQNLSWQNLNLQSHPHLSTAPSQSSHPGMPYSGLPNFSPDMDLGMGDFGDMGMGSTIGMGMNLDEIFGNTTGLGGDLGGTGMEWMDMGAGGDDTSNDQKWM